MKSYIQLTPYVIESYMDKIISNDFILAEMSIETRGKALYLVCDNMDIHIANLPASVSELIEEGIVKIFCWNLQRDHIVLTLKQV